MRCLTLALAGLLAACGGDTATSGADAGPDDASLAPAKETLCTDGVDNDGDGKTDCDDPDCAAVPACHPSNCAYQTDCGNIVDEMVTDCCIGGSCRPPGAENNDGSPISSTVTVALSFGSDLVKTQPQSAVVRFIYPEKIDGTPLTCDEVVGSTANNTKNCVSEATRHTLDNNSTINQVFRSLYTLKFDSCSGTVCEINFPASVPQGANYLLYGEAWYGARDLNDPTGQCAATYCAAGQSVKQANVTYTVLFQ